MMADKILAFLKSLHLPDTLPGGVTAMNPYQDDVAFQVCKKFYKKYYNDENQRTLIIGINPGRFGGGITGVPFTDPIKLETYCNIQTPFAKKPELSADFIYKMVMAYGSTETFYKKFYVSAVSPLGFVKDGKNINYYDIRELQNSIFNYIINSINKQIALGLNTRICFCLGEGQNFKYLSNLNREHKFFETIVPLPHPRFIMQYRRKRVDEFITLYLEKLSATT